MIQAREKTVSQTQLLQFVRYAMLASVAGFGAAAWFLARQQGRVLQPVLQIAALQAATFIVLIIAGIMVFVLRTVRDKSTGSPQRARVILIAWGAAELPALMGAAYMMFTARPVPYLCGAAVFALALILHPASVEPPHS